MKGSYQIFPDERLIVFAVEGKPTLEGMRQLFQRFSTDSDYDVSFSGIADLRKVETNMTREEVKQLAAEVVEARLSDGIWIALVESSMTTALTQIYDRVVRQQHPLEVCSTVERASRLLGRDVSPYVAE